MGISHENMAVLCGFSQRSYKCLLLTRSSSVTRALTISVRKGYSSLKNCVWNFQSGMQSGTHLRPVTWPSRSSELLLTAPTWSWWETQTSGRITRAGSCGWLPRRTWSLIIILIPTSLQNKSWNMFRLTQWRKSDGMDCIHALVQKCLIEFKEWVSVRKLKRGFPGHSAGKESACNAGDPILIPGSGRSPGEGIGHPLQYSWASLVVPLVENPPAMWETWVRSLGWEDPLEKGTATHSSILAWRIPWTIQSMELQRVSHDCLSLSLSVRNKSETHYFQVTQMLSLWIRIRQSLSLWFPHVPAKGTSASLGFCL